MKKQTKSSMTRKLDTICSLITRSLGQCCKCGLNDYEKLQCAHIYSRTYKSVRWDLKNLLCLCAKCHFEAHKNPLLFAEFVKSYLGDYEYESLKQRATPLSHHKLHDLENLYNALKGTT
jgi:hypothetical protein